MKTPTTQPAKINAQTPGPLTVARDQFRHLEPDLQLTAPLHGGAFIVARVNRFAESFDDKRDESNARLLAASYTAFDKAGRSLGVDAAELAERLDIATLILATEKLRGMVSNVLTDSQLDTPQLGGARAKCAQTIRETLGPLDAILASVRA